MLKHIVSLFSNNVPLATFLVSFLPTLESRTSIPLALSKQVWGQGVLSPVLAMVISFIGSMLAAVLTLCVTRALKKKFVGFVVESKFKKIRSYLDRFNAKNSTFKKCVYVAGFVALPLPFTGVYTGSLIAGLSSLKFWQALVSIFAGDLVSCICVTLMCISFSNSAFYILICSLLIGIVMLLVNLLSSLHKKS